MQKMTLNEILNKANELGIQYEENSENAGFFIVDEDGNEQQVVLEALFGIDISMK